MLVEEEVVVPGPRGGASIVSPLGTICYAQSADEHRIDEAIVLDGCRCYYSQTMSEEPQSTERKRNIWAPWRMQYIGGLSEGEQDACFLCRYRDNTAGDAENLVIWRGRRTFAVLNRYPYTGGHTMVAPFDHIGGLDDLDASGMLEMMEMVRELRKLLSHSLHAEGFNVGMNIGRCAGAGLPDHLHIHVIPRWSGDTNFITVLGEVRVIPQALQELYAQLRTASEQLDLPKLSP